MKKFQKVKRMRTMYRVMADMFIDFIEGYNYTQIGQYIETLEEARAYAQKTVTKENPNYNCTGDYKIIERTIDEQTFTVIDKVVVNFNWDREVGQYLYAEKCISKYKNEIKKLEESIKRCRTEKSIAQKNKKIEEYKKMLAEAESILAERK